MRRRLGLSLVLLLLALSTAGQEPESTVQTLGDDLQVHPLTETTRRVVSTRDMGEDWGRVPANSLLVLSSSSAALIDTPWTDEQTRLLFQWVEQELGAKIEVVVPTHSHGDCLGGLAAAHALGARSYGHEKTAEFARQEGNPVPQTTFGDRLSVPLGERTLELHHLGAGHTADNIVVWLPDEKILFGGCLIKSAGARTMGYIDEADLDAWPAPLAQVRSEFPDDAVIVPGHGSPGGDDTVRRTLELIEEHIPTAQPIDAQPFFAALSVKDIEASVAWYSKVFGYGVTKEFDLEERGIRIRLLRNDAGFLELVEDRSAVSPREKIPELQKIAQVRGFYKSGVLVEDLDSAVARLEALGVPLRGRIITEDDGSFRSAQIEDPDGNVWQLFEALGVQAAAGL